MPDRAELVRTLIRDHGRTYAEEAGIVLRDKPSPLYRLLVLSTLLSARITADIAVAASVELSRAGYRTSRSLADADWQDVVDALGRAHYRRYDESTATQLIDGANLVLDRWRGDLRRLRDTADGVDSIRDALQEVPGIGPAGADIFLREVQQVWHRLRPFLDDRAIDGARLAGLPTDPDTLAALADGREIGSFAAALVRRSLQK